MQISISRYQYIHYNVGTLTVVVQEAEFGDSIYTIMNERGYDLDMEGDDLVEYIRPALLAAGVPLSDDKKTLRWTLW